MWVCVCVFMYEFSLSACMCDSFPNIRVSLCVRVRLEMRAAVFM